MVMACFEMPCRYLKTILPRLLMLTLVLISVSGCVDDGENCFTKALVYISVGEEQSRVSGFTGGEVSEVDNAIVYIFGEDSRLERVVTLTGEDIANRTPIEVMLYKGHHPQVVVWGNLKNPQEVSEPVPGLRLSDARVRMLEKDGYTLPADKFYYGFKQLVDENVQEVVITTWVGSVSITVCGIENAMNNAGNYYFTIESRYDSYDFYGQPQAGNALLKVDAEAGSYQQEELLFHQPVNLVAYPTISGERQPIYVRLYEKRSEGDILIASVDRDMEGNEIVTHSGENTNVLLDFRDNDEMNVYIKFTPWNYIYQWVWW